jgi:hypothetical protein
VSSNVRSGSTSEPAQGANHLLRHQGPRREPQPPLQR